MRWKTREKNAAAWMIILDANILLYAYNAQENLDVRAVDWLERILSERELIGIPWLCFMAFLRLATAPRGSEHPLSFAAASEVIDGGMDNPQVMIPEPGLRFWKVLRDVGHDGGTRGRGWSDAYLAALAIENGGSFATFDRDFRKFKNLKLIEL